MPLLNSFTETCLFSPVKIFIVAYESLKYDLFTVVVLHFSLEGFIQCISDEGFLTFQNFFCVIPSIFFPLRGEKSNKESSTLKEQRRRAVF